MVESTWLDEVKEAGRKAGRSGASPKDCPFKGASLQRERDEWLAGLSEGRAERKARATR